MTNQAPTLSDNDRVLLFFLAPFVLPVVFGAVPEWRESAAVFLIEHKVLLPVDESRFVLPFVDAGVDWPRIVIAVAVGIALVALGVSAAKRAIRHRQHKKLHSGDRL